MPFVKGNLRFTDCGRATILIPISYYGSVTVEGKSKERDGFLGMMSRCRAEQIPTIPLLQSP